MALIMLAMVTWLTMMSMLKRGNHDDILLMVCIKEDEFWHHIAHDHDYPALITMIS